MNKTSKLLLSDYRAQSTDMRLQIFVQSINPQFVYNKKSAAVLKQLIDDAKDNSKIRLNILEQNILGSKTEARVTPSKIKKMSPIEIKQISDETIEIEQMRRRIINLRQQASRNPAMPTTELYKLEAELHSWEEANGMFAEKPAEISQMDIILGMLGHWEKEGSISHELIYGHQPRLQIESNFSVPVVLGWLQKLSCKQLRNWTIQDDIMVADGKRPTMWTLTDKRSGLPNIVDNNSMLTFSDKGNHITAARGMF